MEGVIIIISTRAESQNQFPWDTEAHGTGGKKVREAGSLSGPSSKHPDLPV